MVADLMGAGEHLPALYNDTSETELSVTPTGLGMHGSLRGAFLMISTAHHFKDWKRRTERKNGRRWYNSHTEQSSCFPVF